MKVKADWPPPKKKLINWVADHMLHFVLSHQIWSWSDISYSKKRFRWHLALTLNNLDLWRWPWNGDINDLIVIDGQLYNRCYIYVRLVERKKCWKVMITYKKKPKEGFHMRYYTIWFLRFENFTSGYTIFDLGAYHEGHSRSTPKTNQLSARPYATSTPLTLTLVILVWWLLRTQFTQKWWENPFSGLLFSFTHFTSLATNFLKQCLSFLKVHILKILKSVMTLAANVARRRNIPGHLVLWTQKNP
jgi:hypothetical protein